MLEQGKKYIVKGKTGPMSFIEESKHFIIFRDAEDNVVTLHKDTHNIIPYDKNLAILELGIKDNINVSNF